MYIHSRSDPPEWQDYSLILTSVSVGNVGQLSADLLISTLWMEHVGSMFDDCFVPVVGNDPFYTGKQSAKCDLVTCCEVYECASKKIIVVQQRAPFIKGKRKQFQRKLVDWIKEKQFAKVIILSSSHSYERLDVQMSGSQNRYLITPKLQETCGTELSDKLQWTELESRPTMSGDGQVYLPGGGIAKSLFEECCGNDIAAIVLLTFCSEGDNAPDAVRLATYLNQWLQLVELEIQAPDVSQNSSTKSWKIPNSWKLNYGSSFDKTIYW